MFILQSFLTSRWMEKKRCRYIPFWFITLHRALIARPLPALFTDDFSGNKRINFADAIRKKYSLNEACVAKKKIAATSLFQRDTVMCGHGIMAFWGKKIRQKNFYFTSCQGKEFINDEEGGLLLKEDVGRWWCVPKKAFAWLKMINVLGKYKLNNRSFLF